MADISRSSFIPKEAPGLTPTRVRRKRTLHVFGFVATTLLVGSLALAAGAYFLESSAKGKLSDAKQSLIEQKNLFQPEHIQEIREFDQRLKIGSVLIENHIAPLKIFAALEAATKQSVQLTSFALEHTPSREMIVTLMGTTPEFESLALQEIEFGDNRTLKNIAFSEVAVNEATEDNPRRMVAFTLEGTIDLAEVRYDGLPVFTPKPVVFEETGDVLSVEEGDTQVLGAAITRENI